MPPEGVNLQEAQVRRNRCERLVAAEGEPDAQMFGVTPSLGTAAFGPVRGGAVGVLREVADAIVTQEAQARGENSAGKGLGGRVDPSEGFGPLGEDPAPAGAVVVGRFAACVLVAAVVGPVGIVGIVEQLPVAPDWQRH